ncbi:hypothetical protein ACFFLM_15645 [Deinococcus oregonensis]|uniref:DNA helicase n=1 Tax=Deinococcus oregonensis TaxID=1805970 RepID=A0ABV6B131_9DEIO
MTSRTSALPAPAMLDARQLMDLMDATAPGEVTVVAAPPGTGKSTAMYEAVLRRSAERYDYGFSPQPFRVLWATHGTHSDQSLGQEARKALEAGQFSLGLPFRVEMLKGRRRVPTQAKYFRQFNWSFNAPLCIISHAHLAVLLRPDAPSHIQDFMQSVDLIVIDEDPLFSLVFSLQDTGRPLTQARLQERVDGGKAGPVEATLLALMQEALEGTTPRLKPLTITHPIMEREQATLTGQPFWEYLRTMLGASPDWDEFADALAQETFKDETPRSVRDDLAQALKEDWIQATNKAPRYSNRFGLTWEMGQPDTIAFRADVLRTLRPDTPPILVLDAYADEGNGQYQRQFFNHRVRVERLGERVPLEAEIIRDWYVDRTNLTQSKQEPRRDHMMDEIGRITELSPKGSLVLSYKAVTSYLSRPAQQHRWRRNAQTLDQTAKEGERSIEFAYWFAGRGVNAYKGRHVIALHAPARPTLFEHHQLAALQPYKASARSKLAGHLRDTELLQMLHRGRQATFALNAPKRPRVILAFKPEGDLEGWLNLRVSTVPRPVRKDTTNLHHQHALEVLGGELFTLLGAVPQVCLSGLGLYHPLPTEAKYVEKTTAALVRYTRHKKRKIPELSQWSEDRSHLHRNLSPYQPLKGDKPQRVLEALAKNPALTGLRQFSVMTSWTDGKTRVYATDEASAEEAIRRLGG